MSSGKYGDGRFIERGEHKSAAFQVRRPIPVIFDGTGERNPYQMQCVLLRTSVLQRDQAEKLLVPGTDYSLPIKQSIEQSIDWTGLFRASSHEPIPCSNKGFVLLQKMGWKGTGLGRSLDGAASCSAATRQTCFLSFRIEDLLHARESACLPKAA